VVISATIVALGGPWWLNGIIGLAIVIIVLLLVRRRTAQVEQVVTPKGNILPTSVRLAKFEPVAKGEKNKMVEPAPVQEVKA
jgi:NADH-quinone oxidoreductase subunit H